MPCYPIANTTTTIGRGMIDATKAAVESQYDATVIYGDSVAPWTPMMLRVSGEVIAVHVEKFASSLEFSEADGGRPTAGGGGRAHRTDGAPRLVLFATNVRSLS